MPAAVKRNKLTGGRKPQPKLTPRQRAAIDEYLVNGFNKRQALLKAGYTNNVASYNPRSVFNHPLVKAEIERRLEKDRKKYDVTRDWLIQRYARIANGAEILARYKRVEEDGSITWDFTDATPDDMAVITELSTDTYKDGRGEDAREVKKLKVALGDPKGALDSLSRILGLFQDTVKVEGEVSIVERLQAARRRVGSRDTKE